jgi:hypothetical protein
MSNAKEITLNPVLPEVTKQEYSEAKKYAVAQAASYKPELAQMFVLGAVQIAMETGNAEELNLVVGLAHAHKDGNSQRDLRVIVAATGNAFKLNKATKQFGGVVKKELAVQNEIVTRGEQSDYRWRHAFKTAWAREEVSVIEKKLAKKKEPEEKNPLAGIIKTLARKGLTEAKVRKYFEAAVKEAYSK